jgi:DNA helicase-2/ATP-dependent DNA helicase PcrA
VETDFNTGYDNLNKAQKDAVDAIDGPVLVVAGPGTGKTQLLSIRVANILNKTDTDASSILCLTFTNFAATNMRERLAKLVGNSAHNVKVRTFHSFAAEIMQTYSEYFWNGASLAIVPDALQLDIIQSILAELPLDNPLASKFAGNFTAIKDIKNSLALSTDAGLTPAKLKAMVEVNQAYIDLIEDRLVEVLEPSLSYKKLEGLNDAIQELPDQPIDESVRPLSSLSRVIKDSLGAAIALDQGTNKTVNTGKWKKRWIQSVQGNKGIFDERKRNNWWLALAGVYAIYRNKMHSLGYYDYSDMIVEVISTLDKNPDLLAAVQESFLYVLIDEFQDANAAQLRLADLVARSSADEDKPNLMAVGDDDQTIFAFNGAEINNMLNFKKSYPSTKVVVLTNNYRSNQAILDMSDKIINQADERLITHMSELNKQLTAKTSHPKSQISLTTYPTKEHELKLVSESIKTAWEDDPEQSLAVLARGHESLRQISYYLHEAGVPIRYEKQNNVLDKDLIIQLERLSEIVVAIGRGDKATVNFNLSRLLTHPVWQIEPKTLWQLATLNSHYASDWLDSMLEYKDTTCSSIANWLVWLSRESSYQPLTIMLDYILGLRAGEVITSPLRQYFLDNKGLNSDYLETLSGLRVIQSHLGEYVGFNSTEPKLEDFVRFMQLNRTLERPIVDESWFVTKDKAVELMTVHKAKGLEFDTVFLLNATEHDWQPRHMGRKPPANLPLQPYGEHFDDYARLAYVAATRARRSFIVSGYLSDAGGKKLLISPLFQDLALIDKSNELDEPSEINVLESSLSWPRLQMIDQKALLKPRLDNFKLSATGLITFLDLSQGGPDRFLERDLLRLPEAKIDYMSYGTAIHSAMQFAQNQVNESALNLSDVVAAYQTKLTSLQLPKVSLVRYLVHGEQVLKKLFTNYGFELEQGGQAEVSIGDANVNEVLLNGTLDHVQKNGNNLLITDYKTGTALTSFDTKAQDKAIKAWRQRTQLLFYCLLAHKSGRFKGINKYIARIVYVEAEDQRQLILRLEPTSEDIERLEKLIIRVWRQIQTLSFEEKLDFTQDIKGIQDFEQYLLQK